MKSEHRHELQTNDLSKWTEKIVQALEFYSNQILWTICGILLVSAGIIYWVRSSRAAESSAWTDLASARSPEDFELAATRNPGTRASDWATLEKGEAYLGSGVRDMFKDRDKANTDLKKARTAFESLTSRSSLAAELRMRALMGHAQCEESMSDGDLNPAIQLYEKVVSDYPQTVFADLAKHRLEELKESGAQGFYAWFHAQNPKPAAAPKPADQGMRDELPIFEPEGPRLDSGDTKGADKPAGDEQGDQPTPPKSIDADKPKEDQPKDESTDKPKDIPAEKPQDEPAEKPQDQPEKPKSDKPESGDSKEQAPADEAAKPE
jgi:hypothetical protein